MSEYTKSGYEAAAKSFNSGDLEVDLSKRYIMVTGANSGIGKVTALEGKASNLNLVYSINHLKLYLLNWFSGQERRHRVHGMPKQRARRTSAQGYRGQDQQQSNNKASLISIVSPKFHNLTVI